MRHKAANTDLSSILTEEIEKEVKEAAEISMGTEINDEDESYIHTLAQQVIEKKKEQLINQSIEKRLILP